MFPERTIAGPTRKLAQYLYPSGLEGIMPSVRREKGAPNKPLAIADPVDILSYSAEFVEI